MADKVTIVNHALTILGADRIIDIAEDSENARKCNAVFDTLSAEVQATHPYNFGLKRLKLALSTTPPAFEFTNAFVIPADCLRVVRSDLDDLEVPYRIEGGMIVTNAGTCNIKYISLITDTSKFSAAFVTTLAERIAAELSYAINSDEVQREAFLKSYYLKQSFAQGINGQEGSGEISTTDTLTNSRA